MDETPWPRNGFVELLLSMPGDDEFADILDHIRDCGCGLSTLELQYFDALCARALTAGPQLWQRESGNLVVLSEADFRALAGDDAAYEREWSAAHDPRGG
jgi:hypothetical protein